MSSCHIPWPEQIIRKVKGREYAGNRILLNKPAMNNLTMLQPEDPKKSDKILMQRPVLKLRDDPGPAIRGISGTAELQSRLLRRAQAMPRSCGRSSF